MEGHGGSAASRDRDSRTQLIANFCNEIGQSQA
jgi:hypothetical protein